ncbi:hypothetical protein [Halonotius roseus]|uniref:Right handed beta helix domain-containing protein n=1 Tax=Halonotius roseus TaxID=2511997 RepID=A0A544QQZ6_9EURY|nr:hypothetical protein [Halonotius roseus]TQQ81865.1 hypothetical protein EWF95_02705 [Halonotius roseus]
MATEISIFDSFEDGDFSEYPNKTDDGSGWTFGSSFVTDGTAGIEITGAKDDLLSYPGDGLSDYPAPGDTWKFDIESSLGTTETSSIHRYWFYFGISDDGSEEYRLDVDVDGNQLGLWYLGGSNERFGVDFSVDYSANTHYSVELTWDDGTLGGSAGQITATITDEDTGTEVSSISGTPAVQLPSNGIQISAEAEAGGYFRTDQYRITNAGATDPIIGGGSGYPNTVAQADATVTVSTLSELDTELASATTGDILYIDGSATLDCGTTERTVPSGVTLASDRGIDGAPGALLHTDAEPTKMIQLNGDSRLCGLRIEGAHPGDDTTGSSSASGVKITGSDEIDNCDIRGFSYVGIDIDVGTGAHVHHNVIRECNRDGLGYGVTANSGTPVIEYNYFNYNRHSVATAGENPGYVCRYNHFGPKEVMHTIDAHSPAGIRYEIYNNIDESVIREWDGGTNHSVNILDIPDDVATITDNWFFNDNAPDPNGDPDVGGQTIVQENVSAWSNVEFSANYYGENASITYSDIIPGYTGYRTQATSALISPGVVGVSSQPVTTALGPIDATATSGNATTIDPVVTVGMGAVSSSATVGSGSVDAPPSTVVPGSVSSIVGVASGAVGTEPAEPVAGPVSPTMGAGSLVTSHLNPAFSVGSVAAGVSGGSVSVRTPLPTAAPGPLGAALMGGSLSAAISDVSMDVGLVGISVDDGLMAAAPSAASAVPGMVTAGIGSGSISATGRVPTAELEVVRIPATGGSLMLTGDVPAASPGPVAATSLAGSATVVGFPAVGSVGVTVLDLDQPAVSVEGVGPLLNPGQVSVDTERGQVGAGGTSPLVVTIPIQLSPNAATGTLGVQDLVVRTRPGPSHTVLYLLGRVSRESRLLGEISGR